jgi:hypothetical protein
MSRHRLHVDKLEQFAKYCEAQGWARVATKGEYEVLRMTKGTQPPLIVHTKLATHAGNAPVHLTLHGIAERLFTSFIREKNYGMRQ